MHQLRPHAEHAYSQHYADRTLCVRTLKRGDKVPSDNHNCIEGNEECGDGNTYRTLVWFAHQCSAVFAETSRRGVSPTQVDTSYFPVNFGSRFSTNDRIASL